MFGVVKKIIKYMFLIYLIFFSVIWLFSPVVARYFISDALVPYHLVLDDDTSIRYNPFMSHLSINDLTLTKDNSVDIVASLNELDVEVRLFQILFDDVYISEFFIDGLYVNVNKEEDKLFVAGVDLSKSSGEAEQEVEESNKENQAPLPYQLKLPKLVLTNSVLELLLDGKSHELAFNELTLQDLIATLSKQNLLLAIDSEVNNAKLAINVQANMEEGIGKLLVDVNLDSIELGAFEQFLPETITDFSGQLSYRASHTINLTADSIAVELQKLSLNIENIAASQSDINVALAKQTLTSESISLTLPNEQAPRVEGQVQLLLSEFNVYTSSAEQILASFQALNLSNIMFKYVDDINVASIDNISLANVIASDNIANEIPALATFSLLNINNVTLSELGASVNTIVLDGLVVDAQLNEDKVLLNLVDLPETEENENTTHDEQVAQNDDVNTTQEVPVSTETNFNIALNEFSITNDINIHFSDHSVKPAYQRDIKFTTLTAGAFDTQKPEQEGLFKILGESNEYTKIEFSGSASPFADVVKYKVDGFINEVNLPEISSYIKDSLGYEIKSGELDLGLELSLIGEDIDGDMDILLRGIELVGADKHEVGNVKEVASMPLNIAIGLLKDSKGNVALTLPLSGKKDDPKFGLSGIMALFIKQVTFSAAKDYAVTTFVPYAKVVSLAFSAGEYALKVRFSDLEYPETVAALQDQQQEFLQQFAALMKDKEDTQVKLCSIATPADIGKAAGTKITEKSDIERLKAISNDRISIFKAYMVKEHGIASSRLLFCSPQINTDKEAKPSISFVI